MNRKSLQDICCESTPSAEGLHPSRSPIHTSTAYVCDSPDTAAAILEGRKPGYAYARDGHPNSDQLAAKCAALHGAGRAVITSSGMAATSLALLSQLKSGDHVLLSSRLYGRTKTVVKELEKFGVSCSTVDVYDLEALAAVLADNSTLARQTRMLIVETISNPMLRVADLREIAGICRKADVLLTVDNTFASPIACRPLELGADLVIESLTKIMNGHGDVTLGMLCGRDDLFINMAETVATWGMTAGPFDCWICERGLSTLFLRFTAACGNALNISRQLQGLSGIERVVYPGLSTHPDHKKAASLLRDDSGKVVPGNMVTIQLTGGLPSAERFIRDCGVHFVPSLGELTTTLSHPASTSHKSMPAAEREALGIGDGIIRLSIGIESPDYVVGAIRDALVGLDFQGVSNVR
ncbi:MAG: aminotransferase class I/II-fold pyridoxal phosphate-dependent enzyme [Planctomycetota bacterium]